MSFIVAAVGISVATSVYSADQNRKLAHQQQDAIRDQIAADKQQRAEADAKASVAANAKLVESKRRRLASNLSTGAADQTLAGASTLLAQGSRVGSGGSGGAI
jgi:hypothetical protein